MGTPEIEAFLTDLAVLSLEPINHPVLFSEKLSSSELVRNKIYFERVFSLSTPVNAFLLNVRDIELHD
jgi:hypothetical protein